MNQRIRHTAPPPSSKAAAYGYEPYSSSTNKAMYIKGSKTGYTYFGARYLPRRQAGFDSELSLWLSVDPLASKYPSMSPFMYTAGNPVMLTDPNGRGPITPERLKILNSFFYAIALYAGKTGRNDFENEISSVELTVSPGSIHVPITGLRPYSSTWYTRLLGLDKDNNTIEGGANNSFEYGGVINSFGYVYFVGINKTQNTISKVKFLGLIKGYSGEQEYAIEFLSSTSRVMGKIYFPNTAEGKASYGVLKYVSDMIEAASYYSSAILYDTNHKIEYDSPSSQQAYLDKYYPGYKEAYNTNINIKFKNRKIIIKVDYNGTRTKFKLKKG